MATETSPHPGSTQQDWRSAGQVWGDRAVDWAYLVEPGSRRLYQAVFERLGVGPGVVLLDVACGSGLALQLAAERGAVVGGIDASDRLLSIAQDRTPGADLRVGTMFDLPWGPMSFDLVTSFFGIWAGCEAALDEAYRVLRPGGQLALGFFGDDEACPEARVLGALQTLQHEVDAGPSRTHLSITSPGVAEAMLERAGFAVVGRGTVQAASEWPDADIACRAWGATGPAWAARQHSGDEAVWTAIHAVLAPLERPGLGLRILGEFQYVIGRRSSDNQ